LIWTLLVCQVYYCNHNSWDCSPDSATEAIMKKLPTFIITKNEQVTIFMKNLNCFIYRLILAIVCTMGRGYSLNAVNQRGRRTRSSHIEYHGQTTAKCDYDTHDCDFNTHKSDFYTQSVILICMSVIMTLTSVITTHTSVIYTRTNWISTRCA
jgi:hypothetical protein